MHILMIFLDGIGLGTDDTTTNPFASAHAPTLAQLANGHAWTQTTGYQRTDRSLFVPTDPRMGIPGHPQSGTGQAAILTGRNIPQIIGEHYGPKPNADTRALLAEDNFFKQVVAHGKTAALLEGYPPRWHETVNRGKQLRASYQQAAHEAGLPIFDEQAIYAGDALAVDWTGEAWRAQLGYHDTPVYTPPPAAGVKLVELARRYDFSLFSHWMTDVTGHRGTLEEGIALVELFDGVMQGVLSAWDDEEGIVIITSDHGNMEDMTHRKHTDNDVPTVIIGQQKDAFANITTLADIVPAMQEVLLT